MLNQQISLLYTYRRCPYAMRARMALLQNLENNSVMLDFLNNQVRR